jgi:hypothetical protein
MCSRDHVAADGNVGGRLWEDRALTAEQRVAAALDAGLALGERLATVAATTPEQAAYAEGWQDGWRAAEHDIAESWRHVAAAVRQGAGQPSHAELVRRRGDDPGCGQVAADRAVPDFSGGER